MRGEPLERGGRQVGVGDDQVGGREHCGAPRFGERLRGDKVQHPHVVDGHRHVAVLVEDREVVGARKVRRDDRGRHVDARIRARVEQPAAGLVAAEDFTPCRNNLCPWCDYQADCPLCAGRPVERRRPEPPPLDIGQAVDELIATQDRMSSGLARIEGLKDFVARYLTERRIDRVGGSRGSAYLGESGGLEWCEEEATLF